MQKNSSLDGHADFVSKFREALSTVLVNAPMFSEGMGRFGSLCETFPISSEPTHSVSDRKMHVPGFSPSESSPWRRSIDERAPEDLRATAAAKQEKEFEREFFEDIMNYSIHPEPPLFGAIRDLAA